MLQIGSALEVSTIKLERFYRLLTNLKSFMRRIDNAVADVEGQRGEESPFPRRCETGDLENPANRRIRSNP